MPTTNCATGTLTPFVPSAERPWDKFRIMHLYRRMAFGATPMQVEAALALDPAELVDQLVDEAINLPLTPEPVWSNWNISDYDDFFPQRQEQYVQWVVQWFNDMLANGFREKLALFWHNHFVTRFEAYDCPSYLYKYHKLLQEYALGNFRMFTERMGTTPAMLYFLNGVQSTNLSPNENYARELYELFTLGQDNGYTQQDIAETARALTGWVGTFTFCGPVGFVPERHDDGVKTIFGQTGNWGFPEVHDILFEQRADEVATFICSKIYRHFVHPNANEAVVAELATIFKDNNFELAPVFRALFKSDHFFDDYVIGTEVKSPTDFLINLVRESGMSYTDEVLEVLTYYTFILGQELFSPVDVAGWTGNRTWINSNTLTGRWQAAEYYIGSIFQSFPNDLVGLAVDLSGNSNDPALVTREIIDHFIPNGLNDPMAYARATDVFKWEVPQNYYDDGSWNLGWNTVPAQVGLLLLHIVRLPEIQLM
ncbi:MAG: DUF1800 domain-containing protein [Bacteroidota bacterium]